MDLVQTKGGARTVPVHEHLIEQGFLDFVRQHSAGPFFQAAIAE
jgi:hypothetical protein